MTLTQALSKLLAAPRFWLAALVIAAACWTGAHFAPHHEAPSVFEQLYMHLMPAKLVQDPHEHASPYLLSFTLPIPALFDMDDAVAGTQLVLTNLQIFQLAAVLLIFVCFSGVPAYLRTGRGDWISQVCAGFALWVRDEMIYPALGRDVGRKLAPYFLGLFFFILFMNLMGLLPFSATATASIFVTGALAVLTLVSMIGGGMVAQGPVAYWKHLVPAVPWPVLLIMIPVELAGLVIKPFALMIRLFANMTGGHMVVLSFMGLIFFFGATNAAVGWAASPLALGFAVFIMIIESFVALLQAYIFTQLTLLFVGASIHPEH